MNNSSAKVVLDSVGPNGFRITSVEVKYWRMIHSEVLTHRDRARNSASSRAIPFYREGKEQKRMPEIEALGGVAIVSPYHLGDDPTLMKYAIPNCTYTRISTDPFMPEFIGTERPGMQAGAEIEGEHREAALKIIDDMRRSCLAGCMELYELGVHKSIINRYVEPWSYITVLMTATRWKNFFRLRCHPKAEKHFNKVACQIRDALAASTPTPLKDNEWHMPYLRPEERELLNDPSVPQVMKVLGLGANDKPINMADGSLIKILTEVSAARCARLSYMTHDGRRDIKEDLRLFQQLINPKNEDGTDDETIHASALEHVAQASIYKWLRSGPYQGWYQLRKNYPREDVEG